MRPTRSWVGRVAEAVAFHVEVDLTAGTASHTGDATAPDEAFAEAVTAIGYTSVLRAVQR